MTKKSCRPHPVWVWGHVSVMRRLKRHNQEGKTKGNEGEIKRKPKHRWQRSHAGHILSGSRDRSGAQGLDQLKAVAKFSFRRADNLCRLVLRSGREEEGVISNCRLSEGKTWPGALPLSSGQWRLPSVSVWEKPPMHYTGQYCSTNSWCGVSAFAQTLSLVPCIHVWHSCQRKGAMFIISS